MKHNKYGAFFIGLGILLFSACTDNYESFPVEQFSIEYVFSKTDSLGTQARQFLNSTYGTMINGHNGVGGDYLDAASDDAISIKQNDPDVYKLFVGRYSANSRIGSNMGWDEYYEGIRKANIIINNIDVVPFNITFKNVDGEDKPLNFAIKAEARFLRTFFYFELVKRYGGVPLMGDEVHKLGDNMEIPRNTFEQCINYMVDELDDIKYDLRSISKIAASDMEMKEYAHVATIEAAMALKSRILLYAASPLFNEQPISASGDQKELVGYANYDVERWRKAADAAKDFIDTFGPNGNKTFKLTSNYRNIFVSFYNATTNPELIFFRQGEKSHTVETANGPLGFSGNALGNGRTNPTQNLVDAFLMSDGKQRDESTQYDPQNPYANRDPRLGYNILYNGSKWLGRILDTSRGGANNPSSGTEYSKTSYYMCKFMGNYTGITEYNSDSPHLWVLFRYSEILLNYAEALNEIQASPSTEVYSAITDLRERLKIPKGANRLYGLKADMSKEEMRKVIRNERRIEMPFESQRYWDIRRWRIAEDIFKNPLKGMSITKLGSSITYDEVDVLEGNFEEKHYLFPIPYSEVIKNSKMIQNPKW